MSKSPRLIRRTYDTNEEEGDMLYELLIQGENDRWETFKKAEREAERQNGLRGDADRGRVRKLITRRRHPATATAQRAAHSA
jgi:hypothetical protein